MEVFRGFFFHDVHDVVYGNNPDKSVLLVHHRQGQVAVLVKLVGNFFLVVQGFYGNNIINHDVFNLGLGVLCHQLSQGDKTQKFLVLVFHITGIDRFLGHADLLDVFQGLTHCPFGFQVHILGSHDGPG